VQLEEFDKRLVDYGLLISTAHYSGRCCDKEKNEIRYDINAILRTESDDKVRQNYGAVGRRTGNIDEGLEGELKGFCFFRVVIGVTVMPSGIICGCQSCEGI
jgi:hypothetical protein